MSKFTLGSLTADPEPDETPTNANITPSAANAGLQPTPPASVHNFMAQPSLPNMGASSTPHNAGDFSSVASFHPGIQIDQQSNISTTTPKAGEAGGQQQPSAPHFVLEGQRALDKKFLYSTSTVRFIGFAHTSEKFVEGKSGGINTDLLDQATAKGGLDPAIAINSANRVWKERTFVVEPGAGGWTLHILKQKIGGEATKKHSISFSEVTSIDIMASKQQQQQQQEQQPQQQTSSSPQNPDNTNKPFKVHARTTGDTQSGTHFVLEFQSYMSIGLGKMGHLELTCRQPEAVMRNYAFLVNCLEASASLGVHNKRLHQATSKLENEQVMVVANAITNEKQGLVTPLSFKCVLSLSKKIHEPHLQFRGEAQILKAVLLASQYADNPEKLHSMKVDPKATISVKAKFRVLLHPNNLQPRRTQEGIIVLVQSDEQHMAPIELRLIPGKSKLLDVETLRASLVEAIDSMCAMGKAMSGPRVAFNALTGRNDSTSNTNQTPNTSSPQNQNQQQTMMGAAATTPRNTNLQQQQQNSLLAAASAAQQQQLQQQQQSSSASPSPRGALLGQPSSTSPSTAQTAWVDSNLGVVSSSTGKVATTSSSGAGAGGKLASQISAQYQLPSYELGNHNHFLYQQQSNQQRYQLRGNLVEQLESQARFDLESSFMEMVRTLALAAKPSLTAGRGTVIPSIQNAYSASPQRQNILGTTNTNNNASASPERAGASGASMMFSSPRYMQHQQQILRNGAVPIAVSQVAPQQTFTFSSSSMNSWDFVQNNQWPGMLPGDDPHDFRLHIARLLRRRAGGNVDSNLTSKDSGFTNIASSSSSSPTGGRGILLSGNLGSDDPKSKSNAFAAAAASSSYSTSPQQPRSSANSTSPNFHL